MVTVATPVVIRLHNYKGAAVAHQTQSMYYVPLRIGYIRLTSLQVCVDAYKLLNFRNVPHADLEWGRATGIAAHPQS